MSDLLRKYVGHGKVFGPTDAERIEVDDKLVLRKFFDPQNKICNAIKLNPSIVIGRRGSGKTAYLHSVFLDPDYDIILEITTSKTFAQIVSEIEKNTPRYAYVEQVESLWDDLFHLALMTELLKRFPASSKPLAKLSLFVAKNAPNSDNIASRIVKILKALADRSKGELIGSIATVFDEVIGIDFEYAKHIALSILKEKNIKAIILLDSLEKYPIEIPSQAKTLSGLLKCAGKFNECHDRFSIRLCLPAELYHTFFEHVSSNPHKDLTPPSALTLHWIAGELLSISAHRLALFLDLYFPKKLNGYRDASLMTREEVREFLLSFLPSQVINSLGNREDTLGYILRHTQLQPRHLLLYLNAIFERERVHGKNYPHVSAETVVTAIANNEHLLAEEVFSGYSNKHRSVRHICETCIPELPLLFGESELHQLFNRKGKKASGENDFLDFRRILIETGIVGKVVDATDRYIVGRFEYTEPHKLIVSSKDQLCIHPVFASTFNYRIESTQAMRAVYPYGSDPDGEDYRNFVSITDD
jgi:hypothetical protein